MIGHLLWEIQDISSSLLSTIIFSIAVLELLVIPVAKYTVYFRFFLMGLVGFFSSFIDITVFMPHGLKVTL